MSAAQEYEELMRDKTRRTRHPDDDNDDAQSFLHLSDESDSDVTPPASVAEPRPASIISYRNTIPMKRYGGANTGPKGVISDAQNFQDSRRSQRASMRSTSSVIAPAHSPASNEQVPAEKIDEEDEGELDHEEEDGFLKKWRQSRIKEMQNGPKESRMHEASHRLRLFGSLTMVDPDGYLDAVEKSGPDTVVIVFIYDDYSQVSDLFERCVRTLASKHQDTRFVKLHYEDAQMEPVGVPAVIAYRNGDKFAGLVPLVNEMPDDAELDALTLEAVFKRHQILG